MKTVYEVEARAEFDALTDADLELIESTVEALRRKYPYLQIEYGHRGWHEPVALDAKAARRRQRDRERKARQRAARGTMARAEYIATSLSQTKPWAALGMSRSTWYRQRRIQP
jgi:hypothetical protein